MSEWIRLPLYALLVPFVVVLFVFRLASLLPVALMMEAAKACGDEKTAARLNRYLEWAVGNRRSDA